MGSCRSRQRLPTRSRASTAIWNGRSGSTSRDDVDRHPTAPDVRHLDRRRPGREPERDPGGDGGRARADARALPPVPGGEGRAAGGAALAVGSDQRSGARARADSAGGQRTVRRAGRAAARAQPRGAVPASADLHSGAGSRHRPLRAARGIRRADRAARRSAAGRTVAAAARRRLHRRRGPARCDPAGRGVRVSLRPAGDPRACAHPPGLARRDLPDARHLRRLWITRSR